MGAAPILDDKNCIVVVKCEQTLKYIPCWIQKGPHFYLQTKCNVSVILLSELVWEKYRTGTTFLEPFPIHFSDYSKGKVINMYGVT